MANYEIKPQVDEVQEFIEIANDFGNHLDLVREAISNSFDADATEIWIDFSVEEDLGESILKITLTDNGTGMEEEGLQSFFDLGNSPRRGDSNKIGEKGHGTKIYFKSQRVVVKTSDGKVRRIAEMNHPIKKLHNREIPTVKVSSFSETSNPGTIVTIWGYNNNRRSQFTHDNIRDYIKWFTRAGSIQWVFNSDSGDRVRIYLKGLDSDKFEKLNTRHDFGEESPSMRALFDEYLVKAPDYYCRRIVREGHLTNHPEIAYQAVFSIEGSRVKYSYNPMLRRRGYQSGVYTIQDRYGLWLCKDFIPI